MKLNPKVSIVVCTLVLTGYASSPPLSAQTTGSEEPVVASEIPSPARFLVACSPDKPIVLVGETISVRAWAASPTNQRLQYTWSATGGRLQGGGSETRWYFGGVRPKTYQATVQVHDPTVGIADCSVRVIVRSDFILKGGKRETGRSFLLPDQVETQGYGLYSYLLLGSRPNETTRERYLKAIEEYLKFPEITKLGKYIARRELNITYLPLEDGPGPKVLKELVRKSYRPVAEWVLAHYDYARARALLRNVPGDHRKGAYIVSFLKPYDWNAGLSRPYLYQDQSWVPSHLVSLWMKEFLNQAAQERFWEARAGARMALKLRTTIGIMAIGLPEVRKALDDLIAWVT